MLEQFLKCLSIIYGRISLLRNFLYSRGVFKSYKSSLPIICIGNISAGGTGKTPLCIYLVKELRAGGYQPAILSRGYGAEKKGPWLVEKDQKAEVCGDEALLMSQNAACPVVIARDRAQGARFIENNKLADIIILDDGLQHLKLKRTINIITLNLSSQQAVEDMVFDRVLPWGRLREPRTPALARADIIVLSTRNPASKNLAPDTRLLRLLPPQKLSVNCYFEPQAVVDLTGNEQLVPQKVTAFCAIANPEGFFSTLQAMGFEICQKFTFSDHHFFTEHEILGMKEKCGSMPLVCTEKDAVRILPENYDGIYKLQGHAQIDHAEEFMARISVCLSNGIIR